jgi:hypothetical protein
MVMQCTPFHLGAFPATCIAVRRTQPLSFKLGRQKGNMLVVPLNYLIVVPSPVMPAQAASGASAWKSA